MCWGVHHDEMNCLAFTTQLEARGHKPFVNKFVSVHRLMAYRLLDCQANCQANSV